MNLNNITIILCKPQMGENIGSSARAMKIFELSDLRIVSPRDGWPNERAEALSAGAKDIIKGARVYQKIEDSIKDLNYIFAATARKRGFEKDFFSPKESIEKIKKLSTECKDIKIGILFGNEANGLSNDELSYADAGLSIPVSEKYSSLNLAQAVSICCYEIFQSGLTARSSHVEEGNKKTAELSNKGEINQLLSILEKKMDEKNFYSVTEKKDATMLNIKNMLNNKSFTKQEISSLIGILK